MNDRDRELLLGLAAQAAYAEQTMAAAVRDTADAMRLEYPNADDDLMASMVLTCARLTVSMRAAAPLGIDPHDVLGRLVGGFALLATELGGLELET